MEMMHTRFQFDAHKMHSRCRLNAICTEACMKWETGAVHVAKEGKISSKTTNGGNISSKTIK